MWWKKNSNDYTVFPNPSTGFFEVNCPQNTLNKIVLTDIYGHQEIHDKNKIETWSTKRNMLIITGNKGG